MRLGLCLLLLLAAGTAAAGDKPLYRYVDERGVVHFTDKPPSQHARPLVLNRPMVVRHGRSRGGGLSLQPPPFAVHFSTPTPDQTYPDLGAGIAVAVSVMPGLARGFGLVFRVDGQPQTPKPITDIRTTLHGIGAGRHVLTATLISPEGKELARSSAVAIHVKPALAQN